MLAIEEVLLELAGEDMNEQGLPPGFRFHPTDEELITFYLASKVFNGSFCGVQIAEVDLNRCEPWELPDVAKMGEKEWYFFSLRDRKYPTGLRTNRATGAGYWKATGKDREVYSASSGALLGMKKTLVFYKGRAPRGEKTKWVMHEYRLDGDFSYRHACKEEWVICRIFHKSADKKNAILQDNGYLQETPSSPTGSSQLPPLLESPTTLPEYQAQLQPLQNPFLFTHEGNDLKSQISAVMSQSQLFPINGFQAPNYPSGSMLIKSLLSHQDCTLKETTAASTNNAIPKQCKTEANFYHFELLNASLHWGDKIHQPSNPLLFEMDGNNNSSSSGLMGSSTAAAANLHDMSTSIAFDRASIQMMLDQQPIRISAGSSWP